MEPITTVTTGWTIAKTAGEISKKLYEFWKGLKDREAKQQVEEILDKLRELKQSASELEDENRELREKLRFKSDEYEFRTPFHYEKVHPSQPLCPKCFASDVAAPMGEPGQGCTAGYRQCLVCQICVQVEYSNTLQFSCESQHSFPGTDVPGSDDKMIREHVIAQGAIGLLD